jgi:CheY-like chemotaxis protein
MSTPRLRILYAEDDLDTRELTYLILTQAGFDVVCADSAVDAIQLAKEGSFDAYLLDNWMPQISGWELCQQIKGFDSHTPIIFYSAAAYQSDIDKAFAMGAQAYITKPARGEELVSSIQLAVTSGDLGWRSRGASAN